MAYLMTILPWKLFCVARIWKVETDRQKYGRTTCVKVVTINGSDMTVGRPCCVSIKCWVYKMFLVYSSSRTRTYKWIMDRKQSIMNQAQIFVPKNEILFFNTVKCNFPSLNQTFFKEELCIAWYCITVKIKSLEEQVC